MTSKLLIRSALVYTRAYLLNCSCNRSNMFNLQKRLEGVDDERIYYGQRVNIRDRLIAQELQELESSMAKLPSCKLIFPSQPNLHIMELAIRPIEGIYRGGCYKFSIVIPPEYNDVPPTVKCLTRVWHPNISEDGNVCLSVLRQNSLDNFGWMPTRKIFDVISGLYSIFHDLIDFEDALNAQAAQQWFSDKQAFVMKVADYIKRYCR